MSELPQNKIKAMLAAMWQRNQPQILERLAVLDAVASAANAGALPSAQREDAISTAHNLAGTLGTFGYPEGTEIARQLEQLLESPTHNPAQLTALVQQIRASIFPNG